MASSSDARWIEPKAVDPLDGSEELLGTGATVTEFWRWGFSDLRTNIVRGILAEFLVAKAVGATQSMRVAWDNFDVVSSAGTKIEVKSSAYLQSWPQRELSTIRFSGLTGLTWNAKEGWGAEREVRADVFVFAVHTCRSPDLYDPLDPGQWLFYVVPAPAVRDHGARSVGMSFLRGVVPDPVSLDGLARAIEGAAGTPLADST